MPTGWGLRVYNMLENIRFTSWQLDIQRHFPHHWCWALSKRCCSCFSVAKLHFKARLAVSAAATANPGTSQRLQFPTAKMSILEIQFSSQEVHVTSCAIFFSLYTSRLCFDARCFGGQCRLRSLPVPLHATLRLHTALLPWSFIHSLAGNGPHLWL